MIQTDNNCYLPIIETFGLPSMPAVKTYTENEAFLMWNLEDRGKVTVYNDVDKSSTVVDYSRTEHFEVSRFSSNAFIIYKRLSPVSFNRSGQSRRRANLL